MSQNPSVAVPDEREQEQELLTADQIAAADDIEYKTIPTWKLPNGKQGYTRIRSLTAGAFVEWQEASEGPAKKTAGYRLIIESMVDKDGKPIGDNKLIAVLQKKSQKVTDQIVEEILKLNGLRTKSGETRAKND